MARATARRQNARTADALAGGGVLHVEPAAEAASGPGQHHEAYRLVVVGILQRLAEQPQHLDADRVHALGSVERDPGHAILLLVEQIGHDSSLLAGSGQKPD